MPIASALPLRFSKDIVRRYAAAFLAVALALLIRWALNPVLGDSAAYLTLLPAVAFSAWYCGLRPSLLAVAIGLFGAKYWFVPPLRSFRFLNASELVGALMFLSAAGVIMAIIEVHRRENERLHQTHGELEARVKERTEELDAANQSLRELTARLLQLQDEERRRLARELHDSVGQTLAALIMNLSAVGDDIERLIKTASVVTSSAALVRQMNEEIRTISYLLHPPLLDELGLPSALPWYSQGFAERSKIKVELDIPETLGRLSQERETAIFRLVQECLTNIHRHSESPVAKIRITRSANDVRIEVEDRGKGLPPEKQSELALRGTSGVGIRGMRERIGQLGGTLEIRSNGNGTIVAACLPIVDASQSRHAKFAAGGK